jgi:hypothetical protein
MVEGALISSMYSTVSFESNGAAGPAGGGATSDRTGKIATAVLAAVLAIAVLGAAYVINTRSTSYQIEKTNMVQDLGWDHSVEGHRVEDHSGWDYSVDGTNFDDHSGWEHSEEGNSVVLEDHSGWGRSVEDQNIEEAFENDRATVLHRVQMYTAWHQEGSVAGSHFFPQGDSSTATTTFDKSCAAPPSQRGPSQLITAVSSRLR